MAKTSTMKKKPQDLTQYSLRKIRREITEILAIVTAIAKKVLK